jgi:probable metal-binding protein
MWPVWGHRIRLVLFSTVGSNPGNGACTLRPMSQDTLQSIHGHEVIAILIDAEAPMTPADLQAAVTRLFGPAPRFHTCSAYNLTLDGLLALLLNKGKLSYLNGRLHLHREKVCSHTH